MKEHGSVHARPVLARAPSHRLLAGRQRGHSRASHGGVPGPRVPLRDLGFLASEGRFTIPVDDASAAGPLAVHTSFFEFVPEEAIDEKAPPALLAHELEDGRRYYVVLSGGNGLYRYDINDVVEVQGFDERTPRVRFVRKGRDMVSITGEKLHLNQIQAATRDAEETTGLLVWQFRIIPDVRGPALRPPARDPHGLPVAGRGPLLPGRPSTASLASSNIEYASKRRSRRLLAAAPLPDARGLGRPALPGGLPRRQARGPVQVAGDPRRLGRDEPRRGHGERHRCRSSRSALTASSSATSCRARGASTARSASSTSST